MFDSVSVIIPTHNRAGYLPRALNSVFKQTPPPDEIIVVDDGSTDDTETLIKDNFSQVRYLKQTQKGVSAARNAGTRTASGEWNALLDSDDEWLPGKLSAQKQALSASGQLICHTEEIWIRNGQRVNPHKKHAKKGGRIFQHCLPLCAMSPSSIIIHQRVFEELGHFDTSLPACEDYDLWLRITARYPVTFVSKPQIIKYGGHDDQLSKQYWGMDRFRIRALHNLLKAGAPLLSDTDRQAAMSMLKKKTNIFAAGARKRGRLEDATHYESLFQSVQKTTGSH
ncbi:MAG: glycosyltransferase family 2 protein [Gammaproteobacteria bacterium]|nr:glycosyltransferase family 2 protein [Gammaproteobacteria bacterium]